jgi:hypothetical protein
VVVNRSIDPPLAGIWREDSTRLVRALATVGYPVWKWQLIDHVEHVTADRDRRVVHLLWALPAASYSGVSEVLSGAASTCRGHPRRDPVMDVNDPAHLPRGHGRVIP